MKWVRRFVANICALYFWAYLILYFIGKDTERHAQIALWITFVIIMFNATDELANGKPHYYVPRSKAFHQPW